MKYNTEHIQIDKMKLKLQRKLIYLFFFLVIFVAALNGLCNHSDNHTKSKTCTAKLDVAIVLDNSLSIRRENWNKAVIPSVVNILNLLEIEEDKVHTSLILYSENIYIYWNLNSTLNANKKALIEKVENLLNTPLGNWTKTGDALTVANVVLFSTAARKSAKKLLILITDGKTNAGKTVHEPAMDLRNRGVTIMVIGVGGNVSIEECLDIAGCKMNEECIMFTPISWISLEKKINSTIEIACNQVAVNAKCEATTKYTDCDKKCGKGRMYEYIEVETLEPAINSTEGQIGKTCEEQYSLVKELPCEGKMCPVNAVPGEWEMWGICNETCGWGTKKRKRAPDVVEDKYDGLSLEDQNIAREESKPCKIFDCGPCAVEWASWTQCTSYECDEGTTMRHRLTKFDYLDHKCQDDTFEIKGCRNESHCTVPIVESKNDLEPNSASSGGNNATIAGGVVGAIVLLSGLGAAGYYFFNKKTKIPNETMESEVFNAEQKKEVEELDTAVLVDVESESWG